MLESNKEVWKDIPGYKGYYACSNMGKVKSIERITTSTLGRVRKFPSRLMSHNLNKGYPKVSLSKKGVEKTYPIHKLVAMTFLDHKPNGHKIVVNHINFIRTDNRLENLELITARENSNQKHLPSSSDYVGVHWHKNQKKWVSHIVHKGERYHLGSFNNELEAVEYYNNALKSIERGEDITIKRDIYTSKHVGVSYNKRLNKWHAYKAVSGKRKHLGFFNNEIDAFNKVQEFIKSI